MHAAREGPAPAAIDARWVEFVRAAGALALPAVATAAPFLLWHPGDRRGRAAVPCRPGAPRYPISGAGFPALLFDLDVVHDRWAAALVVHAAAHGRRPGGCRSRCCPSRRSRVPAHDRNALRAELAAIEPALTFDAAADQAPTAGSIAYAVSGATVTVATRSATGTCFYLRDTATGGTTYLTNTEYDQPSAPTGTFTATGWR